MSIKILPPINPREEIDFSISHEDAKLLIEIRDKVGKIQAIRVLRMYNKHCGLLQAKIFIETLDV